MDKIKGQVTWAARELAQKAEISAELPWRNNKTPYKIFLAEMLLVRTRVDVVARVYPNIFNHYPTIKVLANANEIDLVNLAKPLGLKKRIPYIIGGAKYIVKNHDGIIPQTIKDLLNVPGIGQYTATAIATFAFGNMLVPADVNIFRFLGRFTGLDIGHKTKGSKDLLKLLPFLSQENTKLKAEVLLDFSRLICNPRKPNCNQCPLTTKCTYFVSCFEKDTMG